VNSAAAIAGTKISPNFGWQAVYTTNYVQAGLNSGSVAMTINDGYGNANLTFNHRAWVPDYTGSAGRIEVSTDSANGSMSFELKDSVTSGVAVGLSQIMLLDADGSVQLNGGTRHIDNVTCIWNCF